MLEQDTRKASSFISAGRVGQNGVSHTMMDTPSDTVSILIDGENHWVSGVDLHTTCTDLICALLQYHDVEKSTSINSTWPSNTSSQLSKNSSLATNTKERKQASYTQCLLKSHQYVIVKQLPDCRFEEYLDGSTRLLDVITANKKCELQLRNLGKTTSNDASPRLMDNQEHMFSMMSMSTDNDSGMGSPVGSSRSERYRNRRRGKQRSGLAAIPATTVFRGISLIPNQNIKQKLKLSSPSSNERLMHLILAQDETINRQIYLLNEKEQQILLIEDEKHRVRQRKLGKNYMLDSYMSSRDKPIEQKLNTQDLNVYEDLPKETNLRELCQSNERNEMEIFWLEKVYAINKELHREEEQLLRLHAKIRKHQMRFAYHTKDEVLQQIDRLDTELGNQVEDIYRAERQLLTANEQLKAKLCVLEYLGYELEVLPTANQHIYPTEMCPTPPNAELRSHSYEDMPKSFMQSVQEAEEDTLHAGHQHYAKSFLSQNLIEKNFKVHNQKDDKTIKKKMFTCGNNVCPSVTDDTCTMTKLDWCCLNRKAGNQCNCVSDIEHFGTLV